jgi:2'-5' RNA ligase
LTIRVFLALELPEDAQRQLLSWIQKLRGMSEGQAEVLRWSRIEQFHLTMRFFGESTEEQCEAMIATTSRVVENHTVVEFAGGHLGAFPDWKRPRILWAGLSMPDDKLFALFSKLDDAFDAAGLGRHDKSQLQPHITLARIKSAAAGAIARMYESERVQSWGGNYVLESLVLFRSELKPSGAVYTPLHRWILAKAN